MSQSAVKVLIIDKEEKNLEALEMLLEKHYIVSSLCESLNCVEHIRNTRPDIVILNPIMYGLNLAEVCQAVKEDTDHPGHVLFISDFGSADDAIWAYKVGADDYIKWPFNKELVLEKIASQVESRVFHKAVASEADEAKQIAITAMRSTSELGKVMSYIMALPDCHDYDELAIELMTAIEGVGLAPQIQFRTNQGSMNYRCENTSLEAQMMSDTSTSDKIAVFGDTIIINGKTVSALATTLPGVHVNKDVCRDNLVVMLNAADSRLQTLIAQQEVESLRSSTIDASLETTELEMKKVNQKFETYTHDMWQSLDHLKLEIQNMFYVNISGARAGRIYLKYH